MPVTGLDVTAAARSRAYADGYDVVLVIDSVAGRSLAGLRAGVGPEVPDVVFAAGARFRVTDVTEAAEGQPAVVRLAELRLAHLVAAATPVPGRFVLAAEHSPAGQALDHAGGGHAGVGDLYPIAHPVPRPRGP